MNFETEKKIRVLTELANWQLKIKNELLKRGGNELLQQALKLCEPMTLEEYNEAMKLLEATHPDFYNQTRKEMIFDSLKSFPLRWFKVAVLYYAGYSHEAPLVAHFYDFLVFMTFVPDLDTSDPYSKTMRDLYYAFWSSRRWEAMKAMHSGD